METDAVPAAGDVRAEQFAVEQSAVAAMCARLDERRSETREALQRAAAAVPVDAAGCFERELEVSRLRHLAADFDAAEAGLCFGRLDAADGYVLYVGRVGLRSDDGTPLVVDWRARAARPFYAATAAHSMQVRRRRHLRVVDRRVVEVSDEILDGSEPSKADLVGDSPLVHALSRARTGQMRSAVSTLQREQDAIIRSTFPGIVVVDGGPGTGKTVVALHRAAYLLYTEPRLADLGALVVGPNRVLLDYIERVLPSLGQGEVALAALDEFVAIDSTATRDIDDARVKGTEMMAGALARYLASRRRLPAAATLGAGVDRVVLSEAVIHDAATRALTDEVAHNRGRARFKQYLIDAAVETLRKTAEEQLDVIDAEVGALVDTDLDAAVADDLRSLGYGPADVPAPAVDFDASAVRAALAADPRTEETIEQMWPCMDGAQLLRAMLTDTGLATYLPALSGRQLEALADSALVGWTAADIPLLDEAGELVDGPPRSYGHVVVDEAQELTEMQWRMIMRRCPSRSMTVVGDFAQAGSESTIRSWTQALRPYVGSRFTQHTLTISYRITAEILSFAQPLLGRIAPGQPVPTAVRRGPRPRRLAASAKHLSETVGRLIDRDLAEYPDELLAVISTRERLQPLATIATGRVRFVSADAARGLEFDSVVVVDPTSIAGAHPSGERNVYIALTRATKRLAVIDVVASS